METKYCPRCFLNLPITEFRKDLREPDGRKRVCKECINRKDYERRPKKIDVVEIKFNELGGRI
jgi:hypothetical protein